MTNFKVGLVVCNLTFRYTESIERWKKHSAEKGKKFMILADKIINLRKKNGWSQEELANKLGVSRQSVSKYESAQAIPDMDKIVKLSDIFGVTTDYLIKDEIETEEFSNTDTAESYPEVKRKISVEEANEYIELKKQSALPIAFGTMLCILSPICLILLAEMSELKKYNISENVATGIGLCVLMMMVAVAVIMFISSGFKLKKYEFLKSEPFETAYGVSGIVKDAKEKSSAKYSRNTIIGIALCILSVIPIFISMVLSTEDFVMLCSVCALLVMVAVGVFMIIMSGMEMSAYNCLLEENDYTRANKRTDKKIGGAVSAYWLIAVAVYLLISFVSGSWHITWVIWPVAGILFPVYRVIVIALTKDKD